MLVRCSYHQSMNAMVFVQRIDNIIDRRSLIFRLDLMYNFSLIFCCKKLSLKARISSIEACYRYDSGYETLPSFLT